MFPSVLVLDSLGPLRRGWKTMANQRTIETKIKLLILKEICKTM